jgi:hypothetical protein
VTGGILDGFTVRPHQWQGWIERFLPPAEPFFMADADTAAALSAAGELTYTRGEFGESFPRFGLDHGLAYNVWAVVGSWVWVAGREARDRIDPVLWAAIRDEQGANRRRQVYDDSWPQPRIDVPRADRLTDGRWLLAPDVWRALGVDVRQRWLREWISWRLDDDDLKPVEAVVAPRYRELTGRYANTFADTSGPNCFAATLGMALGRPQDILPLWLHQEPFLRALRANGYRQVDGVQPQPGEVVVWSDGTGLPVHAAFCVAEDVMFNKSGSSWEQPYALVAFDDVRDFDGIVSTGGTMAVYRTR